MNNVTLMQGYLFLIFILNGIFIGIIFDIFRILRRSFKTPNFVTYIEDGIFWLVSVSSVLYLLFVFNNGEIRGYIFIGIFLGIAMYMLFLSKTIVKFSVKIIVFFKEIIYKILKVIIYPIKIILKFIKNILIIPTKYVYKKLLNTKNLLKNTQKFKIKSKNRKNLKKNEGF